MEGKMKIFNDLLGKKYVFRVIFVIFLVALIFFVKSGKFLEINIYKNIVVEEKVENPESNNYSTEEFSPVHPSTPGLAYDDSDDIPDMVYRYDGTGSMRFGEYFELHDSLELKNSEKGSKMLRNE
jgi:hypothetical protein